MVTGIYHSVNNTGPRVYTCLHWHIKSLSGAVFHPPHNICTCAHASTPGTTAWQRLREKLMQAHGAGSSSLLLSSTQSTTFSTSSTRTSLYPLPETPIPLNPPPLFPTYPRTVHGPRASTVLLSQHCYFSRVHNSGGAPCSFTMAPCMVEEILEGRQRCRRAPVFELAGDRA